MMDGAHGCAGRPCLHLATVSAFDEICFISSSDDCRALERSKNQGVPVLCVWHDLPLPLVDIRLTDLRKSGGAMAGTLGTLRGNRHGLNPENGNKKLELKHLLRMHKLQAALEDL